MFQQHFMSADSGGGNRTYPLIHFLTKLVSELAPGKQSIIIDHSILLYMGKDSRERPPLQTNTILLKIFKGSSFFACFLIEMHLSL